MFYDLLASGKGLKMSCLFFMSSLKTKISLLKISTWLQPTKSRWGWLWFLDFISLSPLCMNGTVFNYTITRCLPWHPALLPTKLMLHSEQAPCPCSCLSWDLFEGINELVNLQTGLETRASSLSSPAHCLLKELGRRWVGWGRGAVFFLQAQKQE